jgi:hypothetical protein
MGIFGADVAIALGGADREAGNRHAFNEHEGIALHYHAVGEGAAVAFVGIADDVFLFGLCAQHGLPLDAGREPRAPAAAQAGFGDMGHDVGRRKAECGFQPLEAIGGAVVAERQRVDHADAGEGEAGLPREKRVCVNGANRQRVGRARERAGFQEAFHVAGAHRAVADAPSRGIYLDKRLQKQKPA